MKYFIVALFVLLVGCGQAPAAVLVFSDNGTYSGAYSTLAAANTAVGVKRVVVTTPQALAADITLANDRTWEFKKGAVITTTGYTLNANNAPVEAGDYQVFAGTGTVTGLNVSKPEWFAINTTPGTTDVTIGMQAAINAAPVINWGSTTYAVSSVSIPANKRIITAATNTIIQQIAGTAVSTRTINIVGSNVEIGDFTVKGNIATDTDEQNHGVFIRGTTGISNVKLGRIVGQNIRGDVVYIGGLSASSNGVSDVSIDGITGANIYRNVVSITGGENIDIGYVTGSQVGFDVFDIEPNANSSACNRIHVGYIKGASVGVIGYASTVVVSGVKIDFMDLDPAFQSNSTPAYSLYQVAIALQSRNARGVRIGHFKANGFTSHAYKNVYSLPAGDVNSQNIVFDYINWNNCSTTETTYQAAALIPAVDTFEINGGTQTAYDVNKYIVFGDSVDPTKAVVKFQNIVSNGRIAKYVSHSDFNNIIVNNAAFDGYVFQNVQNSVVSNSTLTFGRLAGFSTKLIFRNITATTPTIFDGSNTDHIIENSTINTVYYRGGSYLRQYQNAINMGTYYMWVDATGKLRIKSSAPTTDLDGTVVGTQT